MSLRISRRRFVAAAALTVVAGLLVHRSGDFFRVDARDVLGDALWAAMIFWLVSAAAPRVHRLRRALVAAAVCYAVELSQLYQADWINALRGHTLGHLVLGSSFDARDLVAYTAGVVAAALLDRVVRALDAHPDTSLASRGIR